MQIVPNQPSQTEARPSALARPSTTQHCHPEPGTYSLSFLPAQGCFTLAPIAAVLVECIEVVPRSNWLQVKWLWSLLLCINSICRCILWVPPEVCWGIASRLGQVPGSLDSGTWYFGPLFSLRALLSSYTPERGVSPIQRGKECVLVSSQSTRKTIHFQQRQLSVSEHFNVTLVLLPPILWRLPVFQSSLFIVSS